MLNNIINLYFHDLIGGLEWYLTISMQFHGGRKNIDENSWNENKKSYENMKYFNAKSIISQEINRHIHSTYKYIL